MKETYSTLRRNEFERWEIGDVELSSGSLVEIEIDGHWICGVIEFWNDNYYWFSRKDGVAVILTHLIRARLPTSFQGSFASP